MDSENYSERNAGTYLYGEYKNWKFNFAYLKDKQETWGSLPLWAFHLTGPNNTRMLADLGYSHTFSPNFRFEANVTYNSRHTYFNGPFTENDESTKDTLLELTGYWQRDKLSWLFGGSIYRISGRGIASGNYYVPSYHEKLQTLYTQGDYQLTDKTKLILGGQVVKPVEGNWQFVPRVGLIYNFSKNITLKTLYSGAYRAPSQFERTVFTPIIIVGNPDLKPETVTTFDVQLLYKTKDHEVALTYFDSQQKNLIASSFNPQVEAVTFFNQTKTSLRGIELESKSTPLNGLYITSSLSYQTNKNATGQKHYSIAPTWTAKLGINYQLSKGISVGIFDNYFSKAYDSRLRFGQSVQSLNPEPRAFHLMTVNLALELNPLLGWSDKQSLVLNTYVYNALNEEIYSPEFAQGIINSLPSRQGRGIYVGMKYNY